MEEAEKQSVLYRFIQCPVFVINERLSHAFSGQAPTQSVGDDLENRATSRPHLFIMKKIVDPTKACRQRRKREKGSRC